MTKSVDAEISQEDKRSLLDFRTNQALNKLKDKGAIVPPKYFRTRLGRLLVLFGLWVICIFLGLIYSNGSVLWKTPTAQDVIAFDALLFTAAASSFALYQWLDARQEISNERFYERLHVTNSRYLGHPAARELVNHFWVGISGPSTDRHVRRSDFEKTYYVYLEIDNIEYMIERYRKGYVDEELLRRALRTFISRCESREFVQLAKVLGKRAGYTGKTLDAIDILTASF